MSSPQYSAEASFQARGNTMNGCELIVTEVATGTSDVSHQDAFKNAQAAAQDAAQKKLKEELMKINTGSSCQMIVCGPQGSIGPDGKRGRTGPAGQDGVFADIKVPLQFVGGIAIELLASKLNSADVEFLRLLSNISNSTRQDDQVEGSLSANSYKNISQKISDMLTDISTKGTKVGIPLLASQVYGSGLKYFNLGNVQSEIVVRTLETIAENNEYGIDPIFKFHINVLEMPQPQTKQDDAEQLLVRGFLIILGFLMAAP